MEPSLNHPLLNNVEPMTCIVTSGDYPYRQLDCNSAEIRLVVVEPATDASQPLHCQLKHASLRRLPQYKALSYTWGAEDPCNSIILDGRTVPVRGNLENALRRLRQDSHNEPFNLWIDAICINQEDDEEKSDQISKMRIIFEQATMVAVWLGSELANSPLAFKLVHDLTNCAAENLSALITDPTRLDQIKALRELYYRDYWWRIWVIQEVVVAENVTIYCGDNSLPWAIFERVGDILAQVKDDLSKMMYHDPDSVFKLLSSGPRSMKLFRVQRPTLSTDDQAPLLELLRSHKSKYSSDPRDKVYGLVGVSDARDGFKIDYSWSVHTVYLYTAQYIIKTTQNLDVICCKVHDRNSFGLPSWVPDWARNDAHTEHRVMGLHIRSPPFRAGGDTIAITEFLEDGLVLRVEGIMIGTVKTVGIAVDLNKVLSQPVTGASIPKLRAACQAFRQWWSLFRTVRGDSILEQDVFERTVFGGRWSPAYELHQEHRLQLFSSFSKTLLPDPPEVILGLPSTTNFAALGDIDNEKNQKAMVSAASLRMHGKRLVISDSKHMGLAPWDSEEGDILCVLLGCSFPVILRPTDGNYMLIGEVYVDELMNGEAIAQLRKGLHAQTTFKLQ